MNLVAYYRTSSGKQDMSINDQKEEVKEFCATTDEYEFGGEHTIVNEFEDENVSGSVRSLGRDGFSEMIECLREDDTIDGIIVYNFDRLSRDPIDKMFIKFELEKYTLERPIEIIQAEPYTSSKRSIPPMSVNVMKKKENPIMELYNALAFVMKAFFDAQYLLMIGKHTKKSLRQKRQRGEPTGKTPFGLVTDKQLFADQSSATEYLPGDQFAEVVAVLNDFAEAGEDPYNGDELSAYGVGKKYGLKSPTARVRDIWDRREMYRDVILNVRDNLDEYKGRELSDDYKTNDLERIANLPVKF